MHDSHVARATDAPTGPPFRLLAVDHGSGLGAVVNMAGVGLGTLIAMMMTGSLAVPAGVATVNAQQHADAQLCNQTRWNNRRTAQLKLLTDEAWAANKDYLDPAAAIAQTAENSWKATKIILMVSNTVYKVNLTVVVIMMVIFVSLAYYALFHKRGTIQQAFEAVRGIKVE